MPSAVLEDNNIEAVATFGSFLDELLARAEFVKQSAAIEPALEKADFQDLFLRLDEVLPGSEAKPSAEQAEQKNGHLFPIVEAAVRHVFTNLVATISIDSPDFVRVWNLLDIVSILSDSERCDPALLFWLAEELLDGQTIKGCHMVFEFLESRRERIITAKHFNSQKLVILRACNELLRRLSRAEDAAFCGRIYIFLFQSFPLGDRSSVNLRGEYHVENVTTFDEVPAKVAQPDSSEQMDIDGQNGDAKKPAADQKNAKAVSFDGKKKPLSEKPLDPDDLYPIFWSLQESFSQPKKLFETAYLADFKAGLEATMNTFKSIPPDQGVKARADKPEKQADESKKNLKRKFEDEDGLANGFNPKYLTSRDLFELEISDISFRRHILVQALIIMDFLLSLSAKSKEKLATIKTQNKSVTYSDQTLGEEDTQWATDMKKAIADYLKQGIEGPYFYRMVETVLSRDKNWVRWKSENCPSIEMPPVSPAAYNEAKAVTKRMTANKRLRATPMGSLPLTFLVDDDPETAMEKYKAPERYSLPDLASFKRKIADDDFEIEMPTNSQTKAAAIESKASKTWRALRIASRSKLAVFDKIEKYEQIDAIFEEDVGVPEVEDGQGSAEEAAEMPEDQTPIVILDATTPGKTREKSALVNLLLEKHPGVFARVPTHISRKAEEGEKDGIDHFFVDAQAFSMMRDGDQFLEFSDNDGVNHGTSRKSVEAISDSGKVPILELDRDGAQQLTDLGYPARSIFVEPPPQEILEARLKEQGHSSEEAQKLLESATADAQHAKSAGFYDVTITHTNTGDALKSLEEFIFGPSKQPETNGETDGDAAKDVPMDDAQNGTEGVAVAE